MSSRRLAISSLLCDARQDDVDVDSDDNAPTDTPLPTPMTLQPTPQRHRTSSPPQRASAETESHMYGIRGGPPTSLAQRSSESPPLQRPAYASYPPPSRSTLPHRSTTSMSPRLAQSHHGQEQYAQGHPDTSLSPSVSPLYPSHPPPPPRTIYTESAVRPGSSHSSQGSFNYAHSQMQTQPQPQSEVHHSLSLNTSAAASFPRRTSGPLSSMSPSASHPSPFSGLEALVQAATEERERLDVQAWRTPVLANQGDRGKDRKRSPHRLSPVVTTSMLPRGPSPILIRHPDSLRSPVVQAFPGFPTASSSRSRDVVRPVHVDHSRSTIVPTTYDNSYVRHQQHERLDERPLKRPSAHDMKPAMAEISPVLRATPFPPHISHPIDAVSHLRSEVRGELEPTRRAQQTVIPHPRNASPLQRYTWEQTDSQITRSRDAPSASTVMALQHFPLSPVIAGPMEQTVAPHPVMHIPASGSLLGPGHVSPDFASNIPDKHSYSSRDVKLVAVEAPGTSILTFEQEAPQNEVLQPGFTSVALSLSEERTKLDVGPPNDTIPYVGPPVQKTSHVSGKSRKKSEEKRHKRTTSNDQNDVSDLQYARREPVSQQWEESKAQLDDEEQDAHDFLLNTFDRPDWAMSSSRQSPVPTADQMNIDIPQSVETVKPYVPLSSAVVIKPEDIPEPPSSPPRDQNQDQEIENALAAVMIEGGESLTVAEVYAPSEPMDQDQEIDDALAEVMIEENENMPVDEGYPPSEPIDASDADLQADLDWLDDIDHDEPEEVMHVNDDVDDELMRLVGDEPARPRASPFDRYHREAAGSSQAHSHGRKVGNTGGARHASPSVAGRSTPALSDRGSMLPPNVPVAKLNRKASSGGNKGGKGSKAKGEGKASKTNTSKARNSGSATASSKSKSAKETKGKVSELSGVLDYAASLSASSPLAHTSGSAPPNDDVFQNVTVTMSGRMITKTKKSAFSSTSKPTAKSGTRAPSQANSVASGAGGRATPTALASSPAPAPAHGTKSSSSTSKSRQKSQGGDNTPSGSRSRSKMPRDSIGPEGGNGTAVQENSKEQQMPVDDNEEPEEDNTLYCICKTRYEEGRAMIACDRCDEWYHTSCVKMPDLEIDLVDQFICPPCIHQNPDLDLRTTYKQRCFAGLMHPHPNSVAACHKPTRGAFSKYCSDECGISYMQIKIQVWTKQGGNIHRLWDSVKHARPREGVAVSSTTLPIPKSIAAELEKDSTMKLNGDSEDDTMKAKHKDDREMERLQTRLSNIVREREERKGEMEAVLWRQRLLQLAIQRSERSIEECGWDQRLCFGDEEIAEFGGTALATYDEGGASTFAGQQNGHSEKTNGDVDTVLMDGVEPHPESEWWCRGKKKCSRHSGWQKLRHSEITYEMEIKQSALGVLTTREREVRKRIEDALFPQSPSVKMSRLAGSGINGTYDAMVVDSTGKQV